MESVGVKWPLFGLACLIFVGLWLWLPWPTAVSHGFALLVFIAFLWLTETLQVTLTALLVPIVAVVLQILTLPQALSHLPQNLFSFARKEGFIQFSVLGRETGGEQGQPQAPLSVGNEETDKGHDRLARHRRDHALQSHKDEGACVGGGIKDLNSFMEFANVHVDKPEQVPMRVLIPAFMISELKTAFQIGFMIFLPFLVIDLVVASILMAMGMMMLSPMLISLPFKLMLFVLVDGWTLIMGSLISSFGIGGGG